MKTNGQSYGLTPLIFGPGVSFHVKLPHTHSFGWFLGQNTYLNSSSNSVPPFLDPASSAVHIFN